MTSYIESEDADKLLVWIGIQGWPWALSKAREQGWPDKKIALLLKYNHRKGYLNIEGEIDDGDDTASA